MPTTMFLRLPEARREAVLAAAEAEFGARGFSQGSLNVIARNAGVSKGSLFQYFTDKADLCTYLSDLVCSRIRDAMTEHINTLGWGTDFFGSLHSACVFWMSYYASHPAELAFTTAVNLEPDPATQRLVRNTVNRHYLDVFRPLLRDAVANGQLAADADIEVFLALLMLVLPHLAIAPSLPGLDAVLGLTELSAPEGPADYPGAEKVIARLINALRNGFARR